MTDVAIRSIQNLGLAQGKEFGLVSLEVGMINGPGVRRGIGVATPSRVGVEPVDAGPADAGRPAGVFFSIRAL